MEPEQPQPEAGEQHPLMHTYQDDLAKVMNATEAPVVQEMLADAREQEVVAAQTIQEHTERKWYSISSVFFIVLTLAVLGYGAYYYMHLTVKVVPTMSVGVFPSTDNIVASGTTIQTVLSSLTASTTIPVNKPTLVNLVSNGTTGTLLSDTQLFTFLQATVPEPLQSVISVARLGILNNGTAVLPFIIATVPNPEKASQEFDIAEPSLLQMFAPALNIDLSNYQAEVGQTFQSQYFYNLPVRTLAGVATATTAQNIIFLYGYINNNTIVIATDPTVLQAIYDTIINQH